MYRIKGTILEHAANLIPNDNKNIQIAVSTLVLNYSIASTNFIVDAELQKQCTGHSHKYSGSNYVKAPRRLLCTHLCDHYTPLIT